MAPTSRRKREATLEEFKRLLAQLDSDPIRAWEAYDVLRRKLVMFFQYTHALDAEELAEEALDRVAKKTEPLVNISEFTFGVARNLRKEAQRRNSMKLPASGLDPSKGMRGTEKSAEDTIIRGIDSERDRRCFLLCMQRLPSDDRRLLLEYYPPRSTDLERQRQILAESVGMKIGGLRTRMVRLRAKLVNCLLNCRTKELRGRMSDRGLI